MTSSINKKTGLLAASLTLSAVALSVSAATQTVVNNEKERFIVHFAQQELSQLESDSASGEEFVHRLEGMMMNTASDINADVIHLMPEINAMALELNAEQKALLEGSAGVATVEVDPKRFLQSESTPYGIKEVQAHLVSDAMASNRKVCILDTGYTLGHPDLPSAGVTGNDGHGASDTGNWFEDGNGHGTHVAGTIAALGGNGKGVVGVNPNGQLNLHIVKVFNNAGKWAYGSDLIKAIEQCETAGAQITNMSLSGTGSSTAERLAFENSYKRGMLHIAAAGNHGRNTPPGTESTLHYPASYDSVMAVAAVDSSRKVAVFSAFNRQVEIAAPGVSVNSTWNGSKNRGDYASLNGTSMATPHVAGVAALVWSQHSKCSNQQIRDALNNNAVDLGAQGRDIYYGHGLVQAKAASDYLQQFNCKGDPVDQLPIADFSYQVSDLSVQFTDKSSDDKGISTRSWEFGDGNTSSEANPKHVYAVHNAYQVSLTVTDTLGQTRTVSQKIVLSQQGGGCQYPEWNASTSYTIGDHVSFNDYEYRSTWYSTGAQPNIYSNAWRKLGQCDGGGTPGENQAPKSKFSYVKDQLTVSFKDESTDDVGVVSYLWNFGDGTTSDQKQPQHTYSAAGSYEVTLRVEDAGKLSNSSSRTVSVQQGTGQGCVGLNEWSPSATYVNGDSVSYKSVKYTAKWWTRGDDPENNSQSSGQPWRNEGACN